MLARAKLNATATRPSCEDFKVLWRQVPPAKAGRQAAQIAFSPDGKYLFLSVGTASA